MAPKRERELERDDLEDDKDKIVGDDKSMLADDDDLEDDGPDNAEARRERRVETNEDDDRLAYDDEDEDDVGAAGGGRRARRNRARRLREQQSQQHIAQLTGVVTTLQSQLERMSHGQLSLAAGDIDGQIGQVQGHLSTIDAALAKAVKDGDDAAFAQANRLRDEARDRLSSLAYERRRLEVAAQQRPDPRQLQQRQQVQQGPNPVAVRLSEKFMSRHPWFDPDDPSDEDSQIVKAIDDALANEGSNPGTKQHWQELERRVKARGLGAGGDMDDEDDRDETTQRRSQPSRRGNGGLPPRAGRGSGGRGAGRGDFTLTPFMRETLEAEGILETKGLTEDQLKYRKKLTSQWKEGFQKLSAGGRQ